MPYITDEQALQISDTEEKLSRVQTQLDTLIDGLDDVVLILRSNAVAEVKVMRIEDVLGSAVSEAAHPEHA